VAVTPEMLAKVRRTTGIYDRVLSYGRPAITAKAA